VHPWQLPHQIWLTQVLLLVPLSLLLLRLVLLLLVPPSLPLERQLLLLVPPLLPLQVRLQGLLVPPSLPLQVLLVPLSFPLQRNLLLRPPLRQQLRQQLAQLPPQLHLLPVQGSCKYKKRADIPTLMCDHFHYKSAIGIQYLFKILAVPCPFCKQTPCLACLGTCMPNASAAALQPPCGQSFWGKHQRDMVSFKQSMSNRSPRGCTSSHKQLAAVYCSRPARANSAVHTPAA
jgi:hypothetical protein